MMRPFLAALALIACLGVPALAQEAEEKGLLERGAEMILRGLFAELAPQIEGLSRELGPMLEDLRALVDDMANYEAPVRLPNGDILIRRKPEAPPPVGEGPQIEL